MAQAAGITPAQLRPFFHARAGCLLARDDAARADALPGFCV